jgi:hypothetical protein
MVKKVSVWLSVMYAKEEGKRESGVSVCYTNARIVCAKSKHDDLKANHGGIKKKPTSTEKVSHSSEISTDSVHDV